jgi:hypothetical protein
MIASRDAIDDPRVVECDAQRGHDWQQDQPMPKIPIVAIGQQEKRPLA